MGGNVATDILLHAVLGDAVAEGGGDACHENGLAFLHLSQQFVDIVGGILNQLDDLILSGVLHQLTEAVQIVLVPVDDDGPSGFVQGKVDGIGGPAEQDIENTLDCQKRQEGQRIDQFEMIDHQHHINHTVADQRSQRLGEDQHFDPHKSYVIGTVSPQREQQDHRENKQDEAHMQRDGVIVLG